jgi:hypothetical protein
VAGNRTRKNIDRGVFLCDCGSRVGFSLQIVRSDFMDPNACLTEADRAISDGDLNAARDCLAAYTYWRQSGGIQPLEVARSSLKGDSYARWCVTRLEAARKHQTAEALRG